MTLPTGSRHEWSVNLLGITTGNYHHEPENIMRAATPRPLIGHSGQRVSWDADRWEVNTNIGELLNTDHCYRTQEMPAELCDELMAEAVGDGAGRRGHHVHR